MLSESEEGPDVSSRFMRLDLSSLKEEQRLQHERAQKPTQKQTLDEQERPQEEREQPHSFQQQLQQTWQWTNVGTSSGTSTPKANFVEPRRAFSTTDQPSRVGTPTSLVARSAASRPLSPIPSPREPHDMADSYFQADGRTSASTVPLTPGITRKVAFLGDAEVPTRDNIRTAFGKPILPGPKRSYSVMDYEPVPFTHMPGTALLLVHLPPELHYAIYDFLEPIDSTAFALTSKHFYIIHRQLHGKVSLAARRSGPNDMEWVWRNAGPFITGSGAGRPGGMAVRQNALAELSPRGQVYCRKCRTARCELRNHIREFFPADTEYCEITQKYGATAQPGAKPVCCRSSPRHPHRCGRHTRQQRVVRLS